ncbi:hypothetical protein [Variovorax sp. OV084]|uniref:hypothetical protein n=1 Tax=Variovorax sp. OV084 TaxID=1882777 RepID=UPI0008B4FCC8|nr:hypothetical protein [Variovorax sp. OV084]SEU23338.1 hypothetical protein SAMN05443580_1375 [Variovorax sp. OV084]
MSLSFPAHLKHGGNLNRILELKDGGCNSSETQECFELGGVRLKAVNGDFPLLANLAEMTRKAVPKQVVKAYLRKRQSPAPQPT